MAATMASAFAEIEGPQLDLLAGRSVPRVRAAPTEEAVALAFAGVGYGPFRRVARMLSSRYRRDLCEGEEAVQDTLLDLYVKRRSLFHEDPENWLALLYSLAKFRLTRVETGQGRTASIDALSESAGDAPLIGAEPCIPISMDAEEERKYGRLPARNEGWGRGQMIGAAQRFRDYYGRPPKVADCKAINRLPSPSTIYRVFASFDELILAAGMTPERLGQRRRRWSPVEAAEVCASFKSRHGDWPCWLDVKRYPGELPSTNVMARFFGSTRSAEVGLGVEAILAAGQRLVASDEPRSGSLIARRDPSSQRARRAASTENS